MAEKRYLIFAGQSYYPNGGANDLVSTTMTNEGDAIRYAESLIGKEFTTKFWMSDGGEVDVRMPVEWVHVYDTHKCDVIYKEGKPFGSESEIVIL